MTLPIYMLLGLQMRKGQKAGLAGVFCLGLVIVVFDILRTVESLALLETGNSTVTPVVRNLRIDPAEQSPH